MVGLATAPAGDWGVGPHNHIENEDQNGGATAMPAALANNSTNDVGRIHLVNVTHTVRRQLRHVLDPHHLTSRSFADLNSR